MTATVPAILKYLSDSSNYNIGIQNMDTPTRAKKRRLDHLSWEEKMQRKKLKNRVAAQTSRDRKKAKMDQMEGALQELFSKNETLIQECEDLKKLNERLSAENAELHKKLAVRCVNCAQNRTVECETESGSAESLLRPRGTVTHSAAAVSKQTTEALLKIVLACLLYRTSSTNSTTTSIYLPLNNSHRASFKISPEIWRRLLRRQMFKNQSIVKEKMWQWWGRHQKNWNPVGIAC